MSGENYIAIGDIHGRFDLLEILLARIDASPQLSSSRLVFLGDYVDRGPDSFKVVDKIKGLCEDGRAIAILGNHEDMMLNYHRKRTVTMDDLWMYNGAHKTMDSYGRATGMYGKARFFEAFEKSGHAAWLRSLPYFYETDRAWFSHAPIPQDSKRYMAEYLRPKEGDFRSNVEMLCWTFVDRTTAEEGSWEYDHGKIAVCGHVHRLFDRPPLLLPRIYEQIIYADTGCGCATIAPLTGIVIRDGKCTGYVQAYPSDVKAKVEAS